jgi:hypothetical protein
MDWPGRFLVKQRIKGYERSMLIITQTRHGSDLATGTEYAMIFSGIVSCLKRIFF